MFSEEDMRSDPPPAPPVVVHKTDDEVKDPEDISAADTWFNRHKNTRVPIIALEDDIIKLPEQNFVCFSVIKPEDYGVLHHKDKDYKGSLIKFRGVFKTKAEAEKHIKRIMKIDKHFDIHLVPAFRWAGIDDENLEDTDYADEHIARIMKGYFINENNKIKDIRARISMAEQGDIRSEETTKFWESANQKALEDYESYQRRQDEPDDLEDNSFSTTLEEMVQELDIKSTPRAVMSRKLDAPISRDTVRNVVSEIILDEESETSSIKAQGGDDLDPEP